MAFDGITTAALVSELRETIEGGGISRIIQPEKDELELTVKSKKKVFYLVLSANASLPLLYLAEKKREAPITAPNFCMLLRKHLQGGTISSITQPSLERVVIFTILHRDELGDLRTKKLILELMGKYSNIIFTDEKDTILDSIKRVPASMSSVREVLPGRIYFIPETTHKLDPLEVSGTNGAFSAALSDDSRDLVHALYGTFTGISPSAAEEFVYESGAEARCRFRDLGEKEQKQLESVFRFHMDAVAAGDFSPNLIFKGNAPVEFGVFPYRMYQHDPYRAVRVSSPSEMIRLFYGARERDSRIRQKSADLRHVAATALERVNKKYAIQMNQMKSTEKRDKYRIYGEMLNTYGYGTEPGAREFTCVSYYTNEPLTVPLDPTLTPAENAQKYFARYNKLKRTAEALAGQLEETANDREQLESVLTSIDLAENEADLAEIRRELQDFGFIQRKAAGKKGARREAKSRPYSFTSSDGFEILVGRNNYQNEELSFRTASGNDWWFHVKQAPGSHVIVRSGGREVPDRTFEEAGALAAYYSSKRMSPKVEVDYTERKNLRKKNGGKPGFVIYHTNYSLMAVPDIRNIRRSS